MKLCKVLLILLISVMLGICSVNTPLSKDALPKKMDGANFSTPTTSALSNDLSVNLDNSTSSFCDTYSGNTGENLFISEQKGFPATQSMLIPTTDVNNLNTQEQNPLLQDTSITETPLFSVNNSLLSDLKSVASELSAEIITLSVNTSQHLVSSSVRITNNTNYAIKVNLHSALYNNKGVLGGYGISTLVLSKGESRLSTVVTSITSGISVNTLKIFLWDDNMSSLCDPISREFTYKDTATGITFSNTNPIINMVSSKTLQLSYTVTPSTYQGGVIFTSSVPSVATVNSTGLVTALKVGTTVITATTSDGGATTSCTLTVKNEAISVKLNRDTINMWSGSTYQLKPTTVPVAGIPVTYVSSDTDVITVSSSGLITSKFSGTATVSVFCGEAMSACMVTVYNEADYISTVAAKYESNGNPGTISSGSGDAGGKSYGAFQFSSSSNGPKLFYTWLINSGFNTTIGIALRDAHKADGGKDKTFGTNFDALWKQIAAEAPQEFYSAQLTYTKSQYYDVLFNMLIKSTSNGGLGFNPNNYGIALKSALFSRALQHGVTGAFNRIKNAFTTLGGFSGKTERQLIAAIYAECGMVVSTPPDANSIPISASSETAQKYGLVGKYMRYYSLNSSSVQVGVWLRLNINEPNMLYEILENPPVNITPQD